MITEICGISQPMASWQFSSVNQILLAEIRGKLDIPFRLCANDPYVNSAFITLYRSRCFFLCRKDNHSSPPYHS